jgi:hypothetical protein
VVGPLARRAVVLAAVRQRRLVEGVDHRRVPRLEGQVMAAGEHALRGFAVGRGDEQLVGPEVARTRPSHGHLEHLERTTPLLQ